MCDPNLRTVNIHAKCGGEEDWYYYSPWRAPGAAPVFDPCGVAGGHKPPDGGFGGIYVNTTHAKLGDHGSTTLPEMASGTVWKAGSQVEVSWTMEANHAGGYQYRLTPKAYPLTEDAFQQLPLSFVGMQGLRWAGGAQHGGTEIFFPATDVTEGVVPAGYAWRKNPIPLLGNTAGVPGESGVPSFPPPCTNTTMCTGGVDGDQSAMVHLMEVVDTLQIPPQMPGGEYVLGWRWDCEQSNQIWSSCSDVTIRR
jgi:hypothetical protein